MALKQRSTRNDPRFLSAPFEVAISVLFVLTAINFGQQLIHLPKAYPHVGLLELPVWLLWIWGAMVFVGGVFMFAGTVVGPYLRLHRGVEKAGLWLAGMAWLTLGASDIVVEPHTPFAWLTYFSVCLGCGLRLYALHRIEKALEVASIQIHEGDEQDENRQ